MKRIGRMVGSFGILVSLELNSPALVQGRDRSDAARISPQLVTELQGSGISIAVPTESLVTELEGCDLIYPTSQTGS